MELVKLLIADSRSTGDIQEKLKRLFAGTIEQMLVVENESASFYASICSDLKNRGVTNIFIACNDNLTGLNNAIKSIFLKTKNQL